jgi:ATP-dependent exoDNAse (exonuclease V) alpha subunit
MTDVSGIAGAGKSHLLKQVEKATIAAGKTVAILSPTDASVKDLHKAGFQARTFQGFQIRPEPADLFVIDEASILSIPQMLWLVKQARQEDSRVLLVGDNAQHRSVERGDALRILERSGTVRYVELLQTQRQKVPALKAAIEDLKAGRLQAGWEKLEHHGVIKEVTDGVELRQRAVEEHLKAIRVGRTSLMISPRHEEARKVAAVVHQQLKAEGVISAEDHAVTVLPPHGSRVRSAPGRLTLRARPSGRIPYAYGGRIQAWREVDREKAELRDRYTRAQFEGPAVQTI